jgi:hypothetical protein
VSIFAKIIINCCAGLLFFNPWMKLFPAVRFIPRKKINREFPSFFLRGDTAAIRARHTKNKQM